MAVGVSEEHDLSALIGDVADLLATLRGSDIVELEVVNASARLRVRRRSDTAGVVAAAAPLPTPAPPPGTIPVATPLAGVFYRRPSPTEPSFVEVGDVLMPGQVLCLIEAMKVFNELRTEHAGRVSAILAGDGQMVTAGAVIFLLEPIEVPPALPPL